MACIAQGKICVSDDFLADVAIDHDFVDESQRTFQGDVPFSQVLSGGVLMARRTSSECELIIATLPFALIDLFDLDPGFGIHHVDVSAQRGVNLIVRRQVGIICLGGKRRKGDE